MTDVATLQPVEGPSAWRGEDLAGGGEWIWHLSESEVTELEAVGRRFVDADPNLRDVSIEDFPLPHCADSVSAWADDLDRGRGFVLARGLRSEQYPDALSGAIFFLLGLHLGQPMHQNVGGEILGHVKAADGDPAKLVSSQTTAELQFHSDSSDVVGLFCLRGARSGGASRLMSGAAIYNEVLARRPDLAPLLFDVYYHDWSVQDPAAPQHAYDSPICSWVDGVFSIYAGTSMIFSAQQYPEVPRLRDEQIELLHLLDEVADDPRLPLDMDFQPGDIQWLLNAAVLHSRTEYVDYPEPERRRHLLRLWLHHDVARPVVPRFGKHVVKGRAETAGGVDGNERAVHITQAVVPSWEA
jgi:hypothetical protein